MNDNKEKVIIANISGFYGDRLSAAGEMLEGGPVDYLTGDYLAELTMAILYKARIKRPEAGYATTFLRQMEGIMGPCLDKKIKVVVNAGGLNPSGLAKALTDVANTLQIHPSIAYIEGDNLMGQIAKLQQSGARFTHLDKNISLAESGLQAVSANAYLGCWGIVEALNQGADIVVTGRVADAAVIMGPAAHHFGWQKDDWDALAGSAVAGHIIECSGQATGGNYSFFEEVPSFKKLGFPLAEVFADGSHIITKHPDTGGLVNVGTVTSQLLYEVNEPAYITPDVVAHFDTIQLEDLGQDRVKVSGIKGSPATNSSKVTINCLGGFRNSITYLITGLDIERKVELIKEIAHDSFGGPGVFEQLEFQFHPTHKDDPASMEEAMASLKISVVDPDPRKAGKLFSSKLVETALSSVPGVCWTGPPGPAKPRIIHFPALMDKKYLQQKVWVNGKESLVDEIIYQGAPYSIQKELPEYHHGFENEAIQMDYLGKLFAAHSGDKGGNANLGIWAKTPRAYAFLENFLTVKKLKELLPDTAEFDIRRYEFPNLLGLNFYLIGFLGEGVAATTRIDAQAKTLGEYLRAKKIAIPKSLL